mmetsp:Transcript_39347/g.83865  ORF Transcript_39347/g.83865 Transcript_39347/m.83865 type:complete len:241 (+) Transcript_39347:638-1360(+)
MKKVIIPWPSVRNTAKRKMTNSALPSMGEMMLSWFTSATSEKSSNSSMPKRSNVITRRVISRQPLGRSHLCKRLAMTAADGGTAQSLRHRRHAPWVLLSDKPSARSELSSSSIISEMAQWPPPTLPGILPTTILLPSGSSLVTPSSSATALAADSVVASLSNSAHKFGVDATSGTKVFERGSVVISKGGRGAETFVHKVHANRRSRTPRAKKMNRSLMMPTMSCDSPPMIHMCVFVLSRS